MVDASKLWLLCSQTLGAFNEITLPVEKDEGKKLTVKRHRFIQNYANPEDVCYCTLILNIKFITMGKFGLAY